MFTGIIEAVGCLGAVSERGRGRRLRLLSPLGAELRPEQSVAVNGVCLTVIQADAEGFEVDVVEETLRKTNLGDLLPGDRVNLERALRPDRPLDGHFVLGHVDTTGVLLEVEDRGGSWLLTISYPESWAVYLVPEGSIAVDGISLTIARLQGDRFSVAIIPYTWAHTNLRFRRPGDRLNLEFDVLGKYVIRYLERRGTGGAVSL
nr:MAG: riboflavin synthase subunit alpha [Bacteroidota bacterium]